MPGGTGKGGRPVLASLWLWFPAEGSSLRAYLFCVLVVLFYAGNILVGKALQEVPPVTIAFSRVLIAFVVLLPLGWRSARRERHLLVRHWRPLLVMAVTAVTLFNTLIYAALVFTSATNVSVLEATIPVATVVLSTVVLHERLRPVQWAGVLVSLTGSLWVVTTGDVRTFTGAGHNLGDAIMVGAVLCWAVYSVTVRRHLHPLPEYGALLAMTGVSVLLLLPAVLAEWVVLGPPPLQPGPYWWGLLYLGVFPSVVALVLYNRAVAQLGASKASVFLNFLPVATMAGASLLLGESISAAQVAGALVVVLGVVLVTRSRRRT